jgi:hypothetical protein
MRSRDSLLLALIALLAADLAGLIVAVTDDEASLGAAILNGSKLNAPLVIYAVQTIGVTLALRGAGRTARAGLGLALLACTVSLTAVAFDGDFAHAGLSDAQIALQCAGAAVTAGLWGVLATRLPRHGRLGARARAV